MNKPLIYGLLLSILMVTAPHADHLPLWISALCAALLVWRAYLVYSGGPLPKRWLLLAITFAGGRTSSTSASVVTRGMEGADALATTAGAAAPNPCSRPNSSATVRPIASICSVSGPTMSAPAPASSR